MKIKNFILQPDITAVILLIVGKLTIVPQMPWIMVGLPFFISFGLGFVNGYLRALKNKNE